jgi:hypothetical protein
VNPGITRPAITQTIATTTARPACSARIGSRASQPNAQAWNAPLISVSSNSSPTSGRLRRLPARSRIRPRMIATIGSSDMSSAA